MTLNNVMDRFKPSKRLMGRSSSFWQNSMRHWHPVLTTKVISTIFFTIGGVFIILGGLIVGIKAQTITVEYSTLSSCMVTKGKKTECKATFTVSKPFKRETYVFYELANFFQNHRKYLLSISPDQLLGHDVSIEDLKLQCPPDQPYANGSFPNPCGLIYSSHFNDTFSLSNESGEVEWDRSHLALAFDTERRYAHDFMGNVHSPKAQDTMVWMRPAGLPNFRKLYARIPAGLAAGTYTIHITSNFPAIQGTKSFVVAEAHPITGTYNKGLGVICLVTGIASIAVVTILIILHASIHKSPKHTNPDLLT